MVRHPTYTEHLEEYTETRPDEIARAATRVISNRAQYEEVEKLTGVPWYFIGVIHMRESNFNFTKHLHNGDSLNKRTVRVPKGYPKSGKPPFTWVESAVDALQIKGLHKRTDWSLEAMCYELERFNGFGYKYRNRTSPYLWAGTDQYSQGKFVADHRFSSTHVDKQLGTVPVLMAVKNIVEQEATTPPLVKRIQEKKEVVKASRKLTILQRLRNAIVGTTTSVLALDWMGLLGQVKQFATDNAGLFIVGGVAVTWGVFKLIEQYSIQDYREGRYVPSGKESKE